MSSPTIGQILSVRYSERFAAARVAPSVGSWGDSYDSAAAESVIGLHNTELVRKRRSRKSLEDVELQAPVPVSWDTHERLLEPLGYFRPAEFEAQQAEGPLESVVTGAALKQPGLRTTR